MVNYLDSRRIMGTTAERSSIPTPATSGGWVEVGRTTAGGGGSDIVVSSLPDKRYYMVLSSWTMSTNAQSRWRFNNDTGSNYAGRVSSNGGADSTITSNVAIPYTNPGFDLTPHWNVGYIANRSANEKLWINHQMHQNTAGAGNAPGRQEQTCKWANTSNAINEIRLNSSGGTYNSGSELVVLGWDPSDTHTTNFWEELASVNGDGTGGFSSGSFTAKKYLWVQIYYDPSTGTHIPAIKFNSDGGSNYADRYSINGAGDGTDVSQVSFYPSSGVTDPQFLNLFIINNTANEKLIISHTARQNTAGAANAPTRTEAVGKWANTSNQITEIEIFDYLGGNLTTTSMMKVWGAD